MTRAASELNGFCKVFFKSGCASLLHRNEYERIKQAIEKADMWIECSDLQDDQMLIRLSRIEFLADYSKAGIVAYDIEQEAVRLVGE